MSVKRPRDDSLDPETQTKRRHITEKVPKFKEIVPSHGIDEDSLCALYLAFREQVAWQQRFSDYVVLYQKKKPLLVDQEDYHLYNNKFIAKILDASVDEKKLRTLATYNNMMHLNPVTQPIQSSPDFQPPPINMEVEQTARTDLILRDDDTFELHIDETIVLKSLLLEYQYWRRTIDDEHKLNFEASILVFDCCVEYNLVDRRSRLLNNAEINKIKGKLMEESARQTADEMMLTQPLVRQPTNIILPPLPKPSPLEKET